MQITIIKTIALSHKALHALSGGIQGLIVRGEKGIAPGALGAVVARNCCRTMTPTGGLGKLDPKDRPNYTSKRIQLTQNVARLTAGVAALQLVWMRPRLPLSSAQQQLLLRITLPNQQRKQV